MKEIPIIRKFDYRRLPEGKLVLTDEAYEQIRLFRIRSNFEDLAVRFCGRQDTKGKVEICACSIEPVT